MHPGKVGLDMQEFPVIDISAFPTASVARTSAAWATVSEKQTLAKRVDEVCRHTGFLSVVGHGIRAEIVSRAWDAARQFFDLPLEKKLKVKMPYIGYPDRHGLEVRLHARNARQ